MKLMLNLTPSLALLSVLATVPVPKAFADAPATEEALARSALVGMQLSVRKAAAQGKVPDALVACVERFSSDSFVPVLHSFLEQNLSADEIAATEKFFLSEVGRKFAKAGIAQAHVAVGEQPPEPAPEVSDSEYAELEQFSRTAAGQKLLVQKVMEGQPVRQAIGARAKELLDSCRAR
jgi:2,4-dienoyl-CoA reductase-like NADH-dependent reductase (Old Yellow Enzyme family)